MLKLKFINLISQWDFPFRISHSHSQCKSMLVKMGINYFKLFYILFDCIEYIDEDRDFFSLYFECLLFSSLTNLINLFPVLGLNLFRGL